MSESLPTPEQIDALYKRLDEEAEAGGYHLNPDREMTRRLVEGLLANQARYGYQACPCRLADGDKEADLDIICPCDYRDPDLDEHGACYCSLYVSEAIVKGERKVRPVPERRPDDPAQRRQALKPVQAEPGAGLPVWRCRVCGYLCARDNPPGVCPICKAKRERFEQMRLTVVLSA